MSGPKKHRILLPICLLLFALTAGCSDEPANDAIIVDDSNNPTANNQPGNNKPGNNQPGNNKPGNNANNPDNPPSFDDSGVAVLLDEQEYQLTNGFSDPITVQVPPNVISMTITVDGPRTDMYGIGHWTGPNDFALIPSGWQNSGLGQMCFKNCNNRIALSDATFAVIAPNNPESKVEAGEHTFTAYGLAPQGYTGAPSNAKVRVTVMVKVRKELPTTGTLDLNLHFSGSNGWTAETAKTDPTFQKIITDLNAIYATIGLEIGELSYRNVDPSYQVIENIQGANSDLMELFSQSSASTLNALNLFFVEEITAPAMPGGGGGGMILGISGGIPGPPMVQGTSKSGVAVTTKTFHGGPGIANIIGHEAGHFLGLFHTTEHQSFGGFMPEHDPLPDTPEKDETYLMHAGGSGTKISPWQGRIIRSNPWVRHSKEAK